MNPVPETHLSRALHDLADVPGPANLADRALTGAKGLRRRRLALGGVAAVAVAGALVAPFLLRPGGQPAQSQVGAAPVAATSSAKTGAKTGAPTASGGPCAEAPRVSETEKRVLPANWPQYVRIAITGLPVRDDYTMQSGYGVCAKQVLEASNAYAVINLGPNREHGHLTLTLDARAGRVDAPGTCADLDRYVDRTMRKAAQWSKGKVLFCQDGTAGTPFVFGVDFMDVVTVTARYADDREVSMESHTAYPSTEHAISAGQLRTVVADHALVDLLPVS